MKDELRQVIVQVLTAIPLGRVATYGQIAELTGMSRGARQVGWLLRSLPSDTQIPWHRVVNHQGNISVPEPGSAFQRQRLEKEGVQFVGNRINLDRYQWRP